MAYHMDDTRTMNRIIEVKFVRAEDGGWNVDVTKEFAPEHGGGTQVFREHAGGGLSDAMNVAKAMITLAPYINETVKA